MISRRILTPIVLAATLLAQVPASAQSPADVAVARDLFREGAKFAQDGEWNEARIRYEKSLALKRAPLTLYSLGVAYQNLRRFVESLESYRAFLVEVRADDEKVKLYEQPAKDAIAALEKQVAKLDIKVVPDDAEDLMLSIDGIIVPEAALGYPRLVDPGKHTVAARALGYRDATQIAEVTEGQQLAVTLRLEPLKSSGFRIGGSDKHGAPVVPTVLIAGGSAAFAVGLTVGLVGVQKASASPTRDGEDAVSARRLALAGDIVSGVGIVAAGTGLTLLLLDKFGKPARPAAKPASGWVLPVVTMGSVGLVGRF
ncbi:MAG: hypothetical protein IPM54_35295 [Polyangiaceae bacterium]|nr:hypothetical protein [Polyangiaceae bacterium]